MKLIGLSLLLCLIGTVELADWEFVREKDGIALYQRVVPGSDIPAFRGVVTMEASPTKVLNVLSNADRYVDWLPQVDQMEIVEEGKDYFIGYVVAEAPWPVSNRDGYFKYTFDFEEKEIRIKALNDYQPEKSGYVRIKKSESTWKIIEDKEQQITVIYQSHTEPGGGIPNWMIRSKMISIPYQSLKGLQKQLKI